MKPLIFTVAAFFGILVQGYVPGSIAGTDSIERSSFEAAAVQSDFAKIFPAPIYTVYQTKRFRQYVGQMIRHRGYLCVEALLVGEHIQNPMSIALVLDFDIVCASPNEDREAVDLHFFQAYIYESGKGYVRFSDMERDFADSCAKYPADCRALKQHLNEILSRE